MHPDNHLLVDGIGDDDLLIQIFNKVEKTGLGQIDQPTGIQLDRLSHRLPFPSHKSANCGLSASYRSSRRKKRSITKTLVSSKTLLVPSHRSLELLHRPIRHSLSDHIVQPIKFLLSFIVRHTWKIRHLLGYLLFHLLPDPLRSRLLNTFRE